MHMTYEKEGKTMEKSWNTFWETGKIDDYLKICAEKEKREERQNGTEPSVDRDGLKGNADWRV